MSRRQFDVVADALQNMRLKVKLNQTWREIHEELSIGNRQGNYLLLTPREHEVLRELLLKATGLDPLKQGSRFENRLDAAAANAVDEKWGGGARAGQMVHVHRIGAPIETRRGPCLTPARTALWMDADDLIHDSAIPVVVIENLEVFRHIGDFHLPADWRPALFIYRGHDQLSSGVSRLLAALPEGTSIAAFTDFDPAGMRIALSLPRVMGWLAPANLDQLRQGSNKELFEKQSRFLMGLLRDTPEGCRLALQTMMEGHVAFTQERALGTGLEISYYPFSGSGSSEVEDVATSPPSN
jgi:hypothetical protein